MKNVLLPVFMSGENSGWLKSQQSRDRVLMFEH